MPSDRDKGPIGTLDLAELLRASAPKKHPVDGYTIEIALEEHLAPIAALDREAYDGYSIEQNVLTAWWERYRRGAYVLLRGTEVIGAVGIWPITAETFARICSGGMDEASIVADCICPPPERGRSLAHWYVADVVLGFEYRAHNSLRGHCANLLIAGSMSLWAVNHHLAPSAQLCAIAATEDGQVLAERYRFKPVATSPDGKQVYTCTVTQPAIERVYLEELARKVPRAERYLWFRERRRVVLGAAVFAAYIVAATGLCLFELPRHVAPSWWTLPHEVVLWFAVVVVGIAVTWPIADANGTRAAGAFSLLALLAAVITLIVSQMQN